MHAWCPDYLVHQYREVVRENKEHKQPLSTVLTSDLEMMVGYLETMLNPTDGQTDDERKG